MTAQAQIDKELVRRHLRSGCGAPGHLKMVLECSSARDIVEQVEEALGIPGARY